MVKMIAQKARVDPIDSNNRICPKRQASVSQHSLSKHACGHSNNSLRSVRQDLAALEAQSGWLYFDFATCRKEGFETLEKLLLGTADVFTEA